MRQWLTNEELSADALKRAFKAPSRGDDRFDGLLSKLKSKLDQPSDERKGG